MRSPDTGKQIGDFVVTPRYTGNGRYEDYIEILNLLGSEINPEITDSIPLASGRNFRPPMYLEAARFIRTLEEVTKRSWRKFDRVEKITNEPRGQINWNKYIQKEYKAENKLRFPVGKNILSEFHDEYSQIRYVFDLCKVELLSANTPLRIRLNIRNKLDYLDEKLYEHFPLQTNLVQVRFSDSPTVKSCKLQANRILDFNLVDSTAWRVDFADVFEKFVQHVFKEVAKESGGRLLANYKFDGYFFRQYAWELNHLEPDAILQKGKATVFIDAKYKSHLYNKYGASEILKEEHRRDLHQLLAYTSFSKTETKFGLLCYPSQEIELREIQYRNSINQTLSKIKIFGLPLNKGSIGEAKRLLLNELMLIEEQSNNESDQILQAVPKV
ncbi:MAG: hypothetical protein UV05_C0012G0013 [candidate division CPR1 bacterium GW2011_GWA2_42_17]|uniref:Uncharacterized protein n=1 Tax=candidate division CPR1 bacterium GW2011_GWA2_42_17 TaxID=1618341 RepID=A0A0G0Z5Y3_9BACT|nr:MAG: hypothetical protein UV05_C0012G0013 [candidate division CPR1 bacterium GW2011_GWA2_42_17]